MKIILTFLTTFILFSCAMPVQAATEGPDIKWSKCFGGRNYDYATDFQVTPDGGYIIGGWTESNDGDVSGIHGYRNGYGDYYDYWIVKLDRNNAIEWSKCLGGSEHDGLASIQLTKDGGYIAAGDSYSTDGDVTKNNHGAADAWIVKLSSKGKIQWQKCYGGSDMEQMEEIRQTSDGGYIATGWTRSNDGDVSGNHGEIDGWILKLDKNGKVQWSKCFGGSEWREGFHSINQTSDGGFLAVGYTESNDGNVKGNHGGSDVWIIKLSKEGKLQWQKCLGGTGMEEANKVQQTKNGDTIVAGWTDSDNGDVTGNHGNRDAWVVLLNKRGEIKWSQCYGGPNRDELRYIQLSASGGFIGCGRSSNYHEGMTDDEIVNSLDAWALKLNNAGLLEWSRRYGGSGNDTGSKIQETRAGNYLLVGIADSRDGDVTGNHGAADMWAAELLKPVPISGITVKPTHVSLAVGETQKLTATIVPRNATSQKVTWISNNASVATVDENGVVTAVRPGNAVINVAAANKTFFARCIITVTGKAFNEVTGVNINPQAATLTVHQSKALTALLEPADAQNTKVSWYSTDTDVASVDETGKVTALKPGLATITVKTHEGGFTARCIIKVTEASVIPVSGISLDQNSAQLSVGQLIKLATAVEPSDAANKTVMWYSSDHRVADVSNEGVVRALTPGTVVIKAKTTDGGFEASCIVDVTENTFVETIGVMLNLDSGELSVGQKGNLTATVEPSNATDTELIWSSSDEKVATVNDVGEVEGVGTGTAVIIVTTGSGGFSAHCRVTVE